MPKATPALTNFTGGEASPYFNGRTDQSRYYNSSQICENFLCLALGPAERRGGTRFIAEVKDSTQRGRAINFEFSDEQAYIIEAGNLYFRFYMNKGQILTGGGAIYEIATPYKTADIPLLKWCQSNDVMYVVHPKYGPRKLTRTGHAAWTLTAIDFIDGPYLDENVTTTTMIPSATNGANITITASAVTGINRGLGFQAGDVGRLIRIKNGAAYGYAKITTVDSATQVHADVKTAFAATTAATTWRMGLWSDYAGWPGSDTFHEERLCFGSSTVERPQRIDGSKTGDFENFTPGTTDGDPLAFSLGFDRVAKISWLASMRVLVAGTRGAEFIIQADTASSALTPTNAKARPHTRRRCANIMPVLIDDAAVFLQLLGRKIMKEQYSFETDSYKAEDLTLLAEQATRPGIVEMAYQSEPFSIIWAVRSDGQLAACTHIAEQQVTAWHRHILGGDAFVESVATIPGSGGSDEVWLIVRRTINGQVKRYVEVLEDPLPLGGNQADAFYVDCGLSYSDPNVAVTELTGLDHLEGETVQILTDGAVHPEKQVVGGKVELDYPANTVHVGLQFVSRLKPMPLEAGQAEGTAQGKTKIISKVIVRMLRSLLGWLGRDDVNREPVNQDRDPDAPMDHPMPLLSGDNVVDFPGDYDTTGDMMIVQDQPLPMTVLSLYPRVVTSDE